MERKIKIEAIVDEDDVTFTIFKSKSISIVEVLGVLDVIKREVNKSLNNKLKISA